MWLHQRNILLPRSWLLLLIMVQQLANKHIYINRYMGYISYALFIIFIYYIDKPNSVLKRRYITLLTKVYIIKAMFFPVVMYELESWTLKEG